MTNGCKIEPIGDYLETDPNGYILNTTSVDLIQPVWRPAIDEIVNVYKEHYGDSLHSAYLRGSVAKGKAIDNISDIDTFAIVSLPKDEIDRTWVTEFRNSMADKFPFVKGVEMIITPLDGFESRRGQQILIKTQSICLFGSNLADDVASFKSGSNTIQHLQHLEKDIDEILEELLPQKDSKQILNDCSWIMKRVVRGGFELVMKRSGLYTRDLYPCYEGFAKYYPEKKSEMYRALELAVCPTIEANEIITTLNNIGKFVVQEATTIQISV